MSNWYTVFCKPRSEALAELNLCNQGYSVYLPRMANRRRRAGGWQDGIEPLFPRYLFMHPRDAAQGLAPVRSTIGVVDLVRFGGHPALVSNDVIKQLQACADLQTGLHAARARFIPGGKIRFVEGPFGGLEGIFEVASGTERAFVLLEMLGKTNRLRVNSDWLLPVSA